MDIMTPVFFERRKQNEDIPFKDRREVQRRRCQGEVSVEQRRLASQVRRYERKSFKIPVRIKINGKGVSGHTEDISREGILVFSGDSLPVGMPMSLNFVFSENVCFLNLSGQVVSCRIIKNPQELYAIGIKFCAVREFEHAILASASYELRNNMSENGRSILRISVSKDSLSGSMSKIVKNDKGTKNETKLVGRQTDLRKSLPRSKMTPVPLQKKIFRYKKTIYLTDTNALGNTYFARYFDWQGIAREEFIRELTPDPVALFVSGIKILTIDAQIRYLQQTYLYDEIEITISATRVRQVSVDLSFTYKKTSDGTAVAIGKQKLAFINSNGQFVEIPAGIRARVMDYLADNVDGKSLAYLGGKAMI